MINFPQTAVVIVILLIRAVALQAADAPQTQPADNHQVIDLYPGVAPGSESWTQTEVWYHNNWDHKQMVRNVVHPTLTVYPPDPAKACGTAVIIAPGGGFRFHSWASEGTQVAEWLAARGVSAFVLKYRLLDTGSPEEFARGPKPATRPTTGPTTPDIAALASDDARQAIKLVRSRAAEFHVGPERIGIVGFSAGGVVTMGVTLHHDAESRPNFAAPIYGPGPQGVVPEDAPPLFILCAADDKGASAGSVRLFQAWQAAGKSAELHEYSKGGHGFGMAQRGLPADHWIDRFADWLEVQGYLKPAH
jgi:acetyl esterase/lipase